MRRVVLGGCQKGDNLTLTWLMMQDEHQLSQLLLYQLRSHIFFGGSIQHEENPSQVEKAEGKLISRCF